MNDSGQRAAQPLVRWERNGDVALITLDRPAQLNALNVQLVTELHALIDELDHDASIAAAVLTGAGRAFSAGGDMVDIGGRVEGGEEVSRLMLMRDLQRAVTALRGSRLPIVGALNGPVYGAGWSLALACDLLVAASDTRFCQVFSRRQLVPDLGSAWLLPRAVGIFRAKELMLLGDELSAADALAMGLVNRVTDNDVQAVAVALELAGRAAAAGASVAAMTKRLIHGSESISFGDALSLEEHAQAIALGAASAREAIAAFVAKQAR